MAVSLLGRLAATAPVPVFALVGAGGRAAVRELRLDPRVEVVDSPRHATILLVAGALPGPLHESARRVHDQLPHPRASVWWPLGATEAPPLPNAVTVAADRRVVEVLAEVHAAVVTGTRDSATTLLESSNPTEWQGRGDHGQGGEGMMGGVPYGRAMAMTADDRDGLTLDQLSLRVGPFLPWLPPGLILDVALQGDVLQQAVPAGNPFVGASDPRPNLGASNLGASDPKASDRDRILSGHGPVPLAALELARTRHHLGAIADLLLLHGLDAAAHRSLTIASRLAATTSVPADSPAREDAPAAPEQARLREAEHDIARLGRWLRRSRALWGATAGIGVIDPVLVDGFGPLARAAGVDRDARSDDPAYRALDFTVITHGEGDALARVRQRLAEATQSLTLAAAADPATMTAATIEGPRGPSHPSAEAVGLLGALDRILAGREWGGAMTTLVSLDLDLEHDARSADHEAVAS